MERDKSWELPDPFLKPDGSRIRKKEEWEGQRRYFKAMLEEQFYGKMPPRPERLTGERIFSEMIWNESAIYEKIRLVTGPAGEISYNVHVFRPKEAGKYIPVVIPGGEFLDREIIRMAVEQRFTVLSYEIGEAAPDDRSGWNQGGCGKAYPDYSWRALAMWAWLASRVIDWLETQDFADSDKVVVTGHSRMGKMALCCGIYDERVAVTAPAGSGCGGMGSLRLNGTRLGEGIGRAERIGVMLREDNFPYWLLDGMRAYGTPDGQAGYRENELGFDANILASCIAPRGLICVEGLDDIWINMFGTQTAWLAAAEVFRFLDVPEKCGIHYREGGHMYNREDWTVVLDFARTILTGEAKRTNYKIIGKDEVKCGYSWKNPTDFQ
ncbi:MAG: hypothetical protein Q4C65_03965 [Eubacteriales bacterium]|nr:hypothetical protein [Eubacteriales bacterium]